MSEFPPRAADELRTRATRLWRVVLGMYAGGLAMGTHWPRLQLGDPEHPPDKMLHYVCFAGLAFFLWQARYFRAFWTLGMFGVLWTLVDETTQAIPGLGRTFSSEDIAASSLGFLSCTLLLWSLRPVGGDMARNRRARLDGLLDMLLARPMPWAALASAGALGASAGVPLAVIANGFDPDATPFQAAVVGGLLGGGSGAMGMLFVGLRREDARMMVERRCLGCGERVPLEADACPTCGRVPLPGQWTDMPLPRWSDVAKAWLRPVLGGAATMLFLFVVWLGLLVAARHWSLAHAVEQWMLDLDRGMTTVLDSTALCIVAALTIDRGRHRSARRVELSDQWCLACGQDLRGTPAKSGAGRCGECGASFVRLK